MAWLYAACRMPHHKEREDECLVGTNRGEIFHITPSREAIELSSGDSDTSAILGLRSFHLDRRSFIAAAYRNGTVKVFEFFPGNKGNIILRKSMQVDAYAVNRLFVFFEDSNYDRFPLIVVGTDSGICYGIRMMFDDDKTGDIHFVFEWSYQCEGAVRAIKPFSLKKGQNYILVSSLDGNIHVLERNGISVNTIPFNLPQTHVYIPEFQRSESDSYVGGYIITFDNRFKKIRFVLKKKIIKEINRCFSGEQKGYEEFAGIGDDVQLLKFKSIDINENYFKVRYYLKSENFNSSERILEEMEALFASGKFEENIHALRALLRRLFFEYFTGLLDDDEKYRKVKILFFRTVEQWDYKGSKNNDKAQLYWIRYMLRGCEKSGNPVQIFNDWFQVSKEVAIKYNIPEADSVNIVKHFISHPNPFFRNKTLQYIRRNITAPEDKKGDEEKTEWEPGLVDTLSGAVIEVLQRYRTGKTAGPLWFELEAVRFLSWLVVNYKNTGFCPSKLCYNVWKNGISPSFFSWLADFILIYQGEVENKGVISTMFRAAGQLDTELKRDNPRTKDILPKLTAFCSEICERKEKAVEQQKENSRECELRGEFIIFFHSIANFLKFQKIDDFSDIAILEKIQIDNKPEYFNAGPQVLNEFYDLSQDMKGYYQEKYDDIYTLNTLKYETFSKIKKTLMQIGENIDSLKDKILWLEYKFYSSILKQWNGIIKEEIDNNVILDFANAIKEYNDRCTADHVAMDIVLIFKNIFTRLNIMAECDRSFLSNSLFIH
ncbi:MAG: hypothetical protein KAW12_11095, partial [Candidatus Aminicenantes bacterium]|nr:hypothetical protein [Candidatus Aminicenantes bacterium]